MSQFPPESPYDPPTQPFGAMPDDSKKGNGLAVASLVCGILGCVPVVTSLLAVLFGFLGLGKTKDPRVGGKGMAIAGLILGVLGIATWGLIAVSFYKLSPAIMAGVEMTTKSPQEFLRALSSGNVDGTMAMTTGVTKDQIQAAVDEAKPWGAFQSFQFTGNVTTNAESVVNGQAVFEKATKSVALTFVNIGDPTKIDAVKFKIKAWSFK